MDHRSSRSSSASSRLSLCSSSSGGMKSSRITLPSPFVDCYLESANKQLLKSTSRWNRFCLDKLGIHYHEEFLASPFDILDKATENNGCFGPLADDERKLYIEQLKEKMTFNISKSDFDEMLLDTDSTRKRLKEFLEEINDQSKENFSSEGPSYLAYELLHDIGHILSYEAAGHEHCRMWQGPPSKALYTTAFNHFARMCWIEALPGSLWKSKMTVCLTDVTSTTDILLMPIKSPLHMVDELVEADTVSVVSVVEVCKKYSNDYSDGSSIDDYICPDALAQHGGELLLYSSFYSKRLFGGKHHSNIRTFPGMIVIGTEVIFTLLVTDTKHLSEVCSKPVVNRTAKIYYSKPKDYLKKEDRDTLMEAITRLNNI